jgi:hypothetical protein
LAAAGLAGAGLTAAGLAGAGLATVGLATVGVTTVGRAGGAVGFEGEEAAIGVDGFGLLTTSGLAG